MKTSIPSPKSAPSITDIRGGKTISITGHGRTEGNAPEPTPTEPVLTPPFEISGLYAVEAVLSKGGMGTTYLGRGLRNKGQEVVIKVPDTRSASTLRRFEKECLTLEQLEHENIVKCLGYSTFSHGGESYPYLAMVYVKGQTLRQRLEGARMPWDEVKILLENMLKALGYIASQGICHRDIKPENIIYDADSQKWVLVDFGIAKTSKAQVWKTLESNDGTWDYMSPEQKSGEQVDIRSDIYSLGKVAWEALLGVRPEAGTKLPYAAGVEGCTDDVDVLIRRMVEFSPKDRYATPEEALEALESSATKVDQDVRRRLYLRRTCKVACWCLGTLVLLGAIWLAGDFVCTAKLKQIAAAEPYSTVKLRKMEAAVGSYPLRWGRRYLSSDDVAAVRKKSEEERKRMQSELEELRLMLLGEMGDEEKAYRCKNFLAKWEKVFSGTADYQEAVGYLAELYSENEVNDVKKMKETLAAVETYERCNLFISDAGAKRYESKVAREQLDVLLQEAAQKRIKLACDEVNAAIERRNLDECYSVYAKCRERMRELNAPAELSETEEKLISAINKLFDDKIREALEKKAYTSAKELLSRYSAAQIPGSVDRVKEKEKRILDGQLVFDWNQVIDRAGQAVENNNFKYAMDALDTFQEKYPNQDKYDLKMYRTTIARNYADYIITQRENYDVYYEEAGKFMEMFSGADYSEIRARVQRLMCWAIHNRIQDIICNENNKPSAKLTALQGIKLRYVSPEHVEYLKSLLTEAQRYAQNNDAWRSFGYCWEQAPFSFANKHFARINIMSVDVDLSASRYKDIKGLGDCDPYVMITRDNQQGDEEQMWRGLAPVNRRSFTVYPEGSFYICVDTESIGVVVGDNDSTFAAGRGGFSHKISTVEEAGSMKSSTYTTSDGTTITLRYKFE